MYSNVITIMRLRTINDIVTCFNNLILRKEDTAIKANKTILYEWFYSSYFHFALQI